MIFRFILSIKRIKKTKKVKSLDCLVLLIQMSLIVGKFPVYGGHQT